MFLEMLRLISLKRKKNFGKFEFWEIPKNTFFHRTLLVAASESFKLLVSKPVNGLKKALLIGPFS